MEAKLECIEQSRSKEPAQSSSFYRLVYSEIEEIGWENLVKLAEDLTFLRLRILDKKGQSHIMEIHLPQSYPKCAPSISAVVPYICELNWSTSSRLKDVMHQFREVVKKLAEQNCSAFFVSSLHLERLQEFWSTMDNIDKVLWVVDPKPASRATSFRQINLGNTCYIILSVNAYNPRSLPECRFLGPNSEVDSLIKTWRRNCRRWMMDKPFAENLATILETSLPGPPDAQKDDQQVECGICYAQCLPIDDELGAKSGSRPDYVCENTSCSRSFHSVCLADWLCSITTTRQSFDVLFGNCPYCSGPVAVKVNNN